MVRPNFIPRTLRGVGGIRLFDLPGVVYPKEMLVVKPGFNRKDGRPYPYVPGWGLTSREAAALLGSTPSATRTWLHRRKVPYRIVGVEGQSLRMYWRKDRVLALARERNPIARQCPDTLILTDEARSILNVGRSTLMRYEQKGRLRVVRMRAPSNKGLRLHSFYERAEVEQLAKHLATTRAKESELNLLRRKHCPAPPAKPIDTTGPLPLPRKRHARHRPTQKSAK